MKRTYSNTSARLILLLALLFTAGLSSCQQDKSETATQTIKPGTWRVALQHADKVEIPFIMEAEERNDSTLLYLVNAEERILVDELSTVGDSVKIRLHIFDADLIAKVEDGKMAGRFVRNDLAYPYSVPFTAEHGNTNRFKANPTAANYTYDGKWEVMFTDKEGKSYKAVGVFEQNGNNVTGTFLTETGDYRYLDGQVEGDQLNLSTFDGNHAYLFTAKPTDENNLKGTFYSGMNYTETWTAKRNANAALADANTLTYLKPGYEKLEFSFPSIDGKGNISLADEKYKGKVVIVQLLGSWCPNCMDETKFLAPYYEKNKAVAWR